MERVAAMKSAFSPSLFDDVEQFEEGQSELGWDVRSTQLSGGPNQIRFDHFRFPEMSVAHHHCQQAMHDVFEPPPGHTVMAVCRAKLPLICNGRHVPPDQMAIVRPVRHVPVRPHLVDNFTPPPPGYKE